MEYGRKKEKRKTNFKEMRCRKMLKLYERLTMRNYYLRDI